MDNMIIGGDFSTNPWQRGTVFSPYISGMYTADRWRCGLVGSGAFTVAKSGDVPANMPINSASLKITVTAVDGSFSSGEIYELLHLVEGYNFAPYAQQDTVLSFWVKATVPGVYCIASHNAGADKTHLAEYTVNTANTWEYKIVNIPASPATGAWNYTTGIGITAQFMLGAGPNFVGTAGWQNGGLYVTANQVNAMANIGNTFQLFDVKWQLGNVPIDTTSRSRQEELLLCQRYFYKTFPQGYNPRQAIGFSDGAIAYRANINGVNNAGVLLRYPVEMRSTPTITPYSPFAYNGNWFNQSLGISSGTFSASNTAPNSVFANNVQTPSDSVGCFMLIHLTAESEL